MIGVSLPLDWLCGTPHSLGDTEQALTELKTRGVSSVELRTVYSYCIICFTEMKSLSEDCKYIRREVCL